MGVEITRMVLAGLCVAALPVRGCHGIGARAFRIANGHPLMPKVTALGCSLTGVVGAFVAGQPRLEATVAALACFGLAGEIAARAARGPASFQTAFIDALHAMTPDDLTLGARVEAA